MNRTTIDLIIMTIITIIIIYLPITLGEDNAKYYSQIILDAWTSPSIFYQVYLEI